MNEEQWYVYIIQTEKNRFYTGIAKDVERRFYEHLFSPKGANFFRSDCPEKIVLVEEYETRSEALKREAQIKRLTRSQKNALIPSAL